MICVLYTERLPWIWWWWDEKDVGRYGFVNVIWFCKWRSLKCGCIDHECGRCLIVQSWTWVDVHWTYLWYWVHWRWLCGWFASMDITSWCRVYLRPYNGTQGYLHEKRNGSSPSSLGPFPPSFLPPLPFRMSWFHSHDHRQITVMECIQCIRMTWMIYSTEVKSNSKDRSN